MARDKNFEPLKGSEGHVVWCGRLESLAKRKGLGALLHYGNDYADAMSDGKVDRFNGVDDDDNAMNGDEDELPTMSSARRMHFQTPGSVGPKHGRMSTITSRNVATIDNERLYGLIIDNVDDSIMLKLQRLCKDDGLGALENLMRLYGTQAKQSIKIHNLKAKISQLEASDCIDFPSYVEEIMQAQSTLEKLGMGVEEDTIKTSIILQLPERYDSIIDLLERTGFKGNIQAWTNEIIGHVEGKDAKSNRKKSLSAKKVIASKTKATTEQEMAQTLCQICNQLGHSALSCPTYLDVSMKTKQFCNFCKNTGHVIKDCPKAQRKDELRRQSQAGARQATMQELDSNEDSDESPCDEDLPRERAIRFEK